ncbi:DMT family transporter [bacterium]|nr:DMT family transporter [bacterium]
MNQYLGEIAALGAAVCWTFTSAFFTESGRRVGSVVVNRLRLLAAGLYLSIFHVLIYGSFYPIDAAPERFLWLGLSGIIGFALGDSCLLESFIRIGIHLSMLLMSLVPIISAIIAWVFLGENLDYMAVLAIVLTVSGVMIVIIDRRRSLPSNGQKHYLTGILFGLGGAVGQAVGLAMSKKGLFGDFSGLSATLIRVSFAIPLVWLIAVLQKKIGTTIHSSKKTGAIKYIALGAFTGPFLGVWLSMIAVQNTFVGIASTLMALPPVFLLPIAHYYFKEKVTMVSILGTLIAVTGTALVFLG